MGNIKLDCLAVNPNNTIVYGIGNAYNDGTYTFTQEKGVLLLVRSEPNPTSLKSIKWTIVSIAQAKFFPSYWSQTFDSVDCAVSRTGVFTALAVNKPANQSQDSINWTGIKYDPALDVTVDAVNSQVGRSMGWEQFETGDDYRWFDARSHMSHAAIYYGQNVKVQGGPAEGVVKERFIHAAMDGYGQLRFGSFGPQDPLSNDTINSWNLSNILSAPKLMSLSQGYAYVYREESDIITTYLLNDLPSYFPTGDIIKAIPGLKLKHIIPGVRNGTSFLACISTNSIYFISNYLETNNTTTNPITSQVHTITTPSSSSTSTSLTPTLRPYLFVTSQYNETYAIDTSPSNPIVQSTFQFGISLSSDGNIYGINLSANSLSNKFAQTENAGPVRVDELYTSQFELLSPPSLPKVETEESHNPNVGFKVLTGLAGGIVVMSVAYLALKRRRRRKLRALETEWAVTSSGRPESIGGGAFYEPARYRLPNYEQQLQGQGQGQAIELTTLGGNQQQHRSTQFSARPDGLDAPPPYSA